MARPTTSLTAALAALLLLAAAAAAQGDWQIGRELEGAGSWAPRRAPPLPPPAPPAAASAAAMELPPWSSLAAHGLPRNLLVWPTPRAPASPPAPTPLRAPGSPPLLSCPAPARRRHLLRPGRLVHPQGRLRAGLPVQEPGHGVGRGRHRRRLPRVCRLLRVRARREGWGRKGRLGAAEEGSGAALQSGAWHMATRAPSPSACCRNPAPPNPSPLPRRCYEVRCDPRASVADGYGNSFDRSRVCKHPGATVVVRTVDNCGCFWGAGGVGEGWLGAGSQRWRERAWRGLQVRGLPCACAAPAPTSPAAPPARPRLSALLKAPASTPAMPTQTNAGEEGWGVLGALGGAGRVLARVQGRAPPDRQPLGPPLPLTLRAPLLCPCRCCGDNSATQGTHFDLSIWWVPAAGGDKRGGAGAGGGGACSPSRTHEQPPSPPRPAAKPPNPLPHPSPLPSAGRLRSWRTWPRAWPPSSSAACPAPTSPPAPPPTAPPACRPRSSPPRWATAATPTTRPPTSPPSPWSCASTTAARSRVRRRAVVVALGAGGRGRRGRGAALGEGRGDCQTAASLPGSHHPSLTPSPPPAPPAPPLQARCGPCKTLMLARAPRW